VSKEVADKFVDALRKLEDGRDVEALVEIDTDDCDVGNVAVPKTFSGHDGLREFWTSYHDNVSEMKSEFRNVFADDAGNAALEWNTSGNANGKDVSYEGVSLLEIADGKVSRFRAYFDPRTVSDKVVD
jgi:ketosteroid isomerase-like protein